MEDQDWKPTSNGPLPASRKRPVRSTAHRSWKQDEYDFLDDDDHPEMGRVVPYRKHSKASTSREDVKPSEVIVINDSDDETGSRGMSLDKKDEEKTSGQSSDSERSSVSAQYLLLQQNCKLKEQVEELEKEVGEAKRAQSQMQSCLDEAAKLRELQLARNLETVIAMIQHYGHPIEFEAKIVNLELIQKKGITEDDLTSIMDTICGEHVKLVKELGVVYTKQEQWKQERATLSALSLCVPQYDRYARYQLETLDKTDPAFEFISDYFTKRVNKHLHPRSSGYGEPPKLEVKSIKRVHNPRLWAKYRAEVDDIWGLCEGRARSFNDELLSAQSMNMAERTNRINEYFLFHGLPHNLAHQIAMQGFDERYAGEHFGALFGKGVYFAETASKSDIYTSPDASDERCMFLSRVCLGETYNTRQAMRNIWKPPMRDDKRGLYNSVRAMKQSDGGCVEYLEYIIYKGAQAYPEYLIMYEHSLGCQCTHCS